MMDTRFCNTCGIEKHDNSFPRNSKGLRQRGNKCNKCSAAYQKNMRKNKPYSARAYKFKTTEDKIAEVLDRKRCEICGADEAKYIDHNHLTGEIRGLLCNECNAGLGFLKDSPTLVKKALEYLTERGHYGDLEC